MPETYLTPDELWKSIIESLTKEFVEFFFPDLYPQIDFTKDYAFIEQELQKLFPESSTTRRYNDKLLKVYLKDETEVWILIHIEIQGYNDASFAERMFEYYYRIYDRYRKPTVALAIFIDENKSYQPAQFNRDFAGTVLNYKYLTYKILNVSERKLLHSKNPFSLVVLAAKYAMTAKKDVERLSKFKFKLIRLLLERGYNFEIINKIFTFVDTLIRLPDNLQLEYNSKIDKLVQKTTTMELKFEHTQTYHVFQKIISEKEHENELLVLEKDEIIREKDKIVLEKEREKDKIVREKDNVISEKDREKLAIIVHSIKNLLERGFPVSEIADCLGLPMAEINQIIVTYQIAK